MSLKKRGQIEIEPNNIAVEATGSKALIPGKAVVSSNNKTETVTPIAPIHGMNLFFHMRCGTKSRSAPKPNSQARVGSE